MKEKIKYSKLSLFDVYNALLTGEIRRFPSNYIDKEKAKELIRYNIFKKFTISENYMENKDEKERLKKELLSLDWKSFLQSVKLGTVFCMFNNVPFKVIDYCFSELDIYHFELPRVSSGYWDEENNRLDALLWIAKRENIDLENLEDVNKRLLKSPSYKLISRKGAIFREEGGVFKFLDLYYKGRYKSWQLPSKDYKWTLKKGIEATKWLIDEVLGWSKQDVCEKISVKVFRDNDLDSMLHRVFNHSPLLALQTTYPELNYRKEDIKSYSINRFKKD